jgi:hypothetical protein
LANEKAFTMNRLILFFLIAGFNIPAKCFSQNTPTYILNFDYNGPANMKIVFDTTAGRKNVWQVGRPSKSVFNAAYSAPRAIVTDTVLPYPINDTSVFTLKCQRQLFMYAGNSYLGLELYYKFNTNSHTDHGMVEASLDSGRHWINLLTDTSKKLIWHSAIPSLDSNTAAGWQFFSVELTKVECCPIRPSIWFRFTFISGNIPTHGDGWMMDNIGIEDQWEGETEYKLQNDLQLYPNPAQDRIYFKTASTEINRRARIFSLDGSLIQEIPVSQEGYLNVRDLPNGLYLLRYGAENAFCWTKFSVQH